MVVEIGGVTGSGCFAGFGVDRRGCFTGKYLAGRRKSFVAE